MADGRQRGEWVRGASLTAVLLGAWVGKAVDPEELLPDRYRDRGPAPPVGRGGVSEADEAEIGWRILGAGLSKCGG